MKPFPYLVLAVAICIGCRKSHTVLIRESVYTGTFQRLTPQGGTIVNVSLTLDSGRYSSEGGSGRYPVICKGSYYTKPDSVYFLNECMFTADFDWTLILSGAYSYTQKEDSLIISRQYQQAFTDIYRLAKKQ